MKRRLLYCFVLVVAMALTAAQSQAADNQVVGPLRTQWENTKNLIVGMAEAIPEAKYDYKPTPEVRSFREQLVHLAGENHTYMGTAAGDKPMDRAAFEGLKSREEIIQALKDSYDNGTKFLATLTDEKALEAIPFRNGQMPRWAIIMANLMDNMDHYGNLVVYVRLNGMVPPRTASRAAAPAAK